MKFDADSTLSQHIGHLEEAIALNPMARNALSDLTMQVGPASNNRYQVPLGAMYPAHVGDSAWIGKLNCPDDLREAMKSNPNAAGLRYVQDGATHKFDLNWSKRGAADADWIAPQTLSPWNVSWFQKIFKEPLAWSSVRKLVSIWPGDNPWASVMNLVLGGFSGFARLAGTGTLGNQNNDQVNVKNGLMSTQVINMSVGYQLTIEERENEQRGNPLAGQMTALKPTYANWALEMLTNAIMYWGNAGTDTLGIFTAVTPTAYSGTTLSAIAAGASTTKGSLMYQALAGLVRDYLSGLKNQVDNVKVAVSTIAYNLLSSTPYSDAYNPTSPTAIFNENFTAGLTKDGRTPFVEIFPDPLLDPHSSSSIINPWNANTYDYMVISSPTIKSGLNDEELDPLVMFGAPLMDYVFPTVPGAYITEYKHLRRIAGMYVPLTSALKVYTGFGIAS